MKNIMVVVALFFAIFILVMNDFHGTVVYDCRDAHWMPDIPIEVKKECAKMQKEDWEKLQRDSKKKLISI